MNTEALCLVFTKAALVVAASGIVIIAAGCSAGGYQKKAFDPDRQNQVDNETILIFQKDANGRFRCTQVVFG
jgi:hypothetical protein